MVPTKPKPANFTGNWPDKMGGVCRHTQVNRKDDAGNTVKQSMYPDCYICDFNIVKKKPSMRAWSWACEREQVIATPELVAELAAKGMAATVGQSLGYRDKVRTVKKKEGDKEIEVQEKALVVVNM